MGLRFRKSIKIAPGLKLNLNKKSVSVTAGTKGAHYTVSSTGKKTASVGIPGTGISYTETSSSGNGGASKCESNQNGSGGKKKARGCLVAALVLLAIYMFGGLYSIFWIPALIALIVFIVRKNSPTRKRNIIISAIIFVTSFIWMFASQSPDPTSIVVSLPQSEYSVSDTAVLDIDLEPGDAHIYDLDISDNDIVDLKFEGDVATLSFNKAGTCSIYFTVNDTLDSNKIDLTVTDPSSSSDGNQGDPIDVVEKTTKKEETTVEITTKEEESTTAKATEEKVSTTEEQVEYVWIPQSGEGKYHSSSSCSSMKNPQKITLSEAEKRGLEPCKRCH